MSDESTVPTGEQISEALKALCGRPLPLSGQTCPECGKPIVAKIFTEVGVGYIRDMWSKEDGVFIPRSGFCHFVRG
jgi:hypothetical protein